MDYIVIASICAGIGFYCGFVIGKSHGKLIQQKTTSVNVCADTIQKLLHKHICSSETCGAKINCAGISKSELEYINSLIQTRTS